MPPPGGRLSRERHPGTRCALAILVVLAVALLAVPPRAAAGAEILRESYAPATWDTSFVNVWGNQRVAQSFIARTDFLVTHIDLFVFDQPETTEPDILQVSIAADAGNRPGAALGTTAKQGIRNWTWVAFALYPWVPLTTGRRYWIVADDAQPRPKGYEWAMNQPGGYGAGEAQWYDASAGTWTNGTGADLFFRVFGVSGPSLVLQVEPGLMPADPGDGVPIDIFFNNSGNDLARTATVDVDLPAGLAYVSDDAAAGGGVETAPLVWTFTDVGMGSHRMTLWTTVEPDPSYYDGESLVAWVYLNYTDATGQRQAPSWDVATVTVLVPYVRTQAYPSPSHVAPGETFNFTVSFFNLGSGHAEYLWLNATAGDRLAILGDDAGTAGGTTVGAQAWLFRNVSAQAYVFNVTVRADPDAWPGDRLELHLTTTYTDGGGHLFGVREATGSASIHGPSIVVELAADASRVHPGETVRLVAYLNNTGDEASATVWLNVTLPTDLTVQDSQPIPGVRTGDVLAYEFASLAPGAHALSLRLRVDPNATLAASLSVIARANVSRAGGGLLRPTSARADLVAVQPRFAVRLTANTGRIATGDTVALLLTWNNSGNEPAARIWLNFTLPAKTLLLNSTAPWSFTNGTAAGWLLSGVGPGEGTIGVLIQANGRLGNGEDLVARLELAYERPDGSVSVSAVASLAFEGVEGGVASFGFELVVMWLAILAAIFLLFLVLGYMDLLPRRRSLIDDVFLLHNSGILICHYSTTLRPDVDSDIASGMLMAVRNFVADALRSKNGTLQELKYGDHRIHMAHGQHSILVVFTRGGNGRSLETRMAEILRDVETAYLKVLESWSGRTEDFKGVEEILRRLVEG